MLLVHTGGGDNINDEHFAVEGVFNLPADLGEHLARFPEWRAPTEDEAAAYAAAVTIDPIPARKPARKAPAKKAAAAPAE